MQALHKARREWTPQRLLDWAATWTSKDATRYLSFYDPSFKPEGSASRSTWFANRTKLLQKSGPVEMKIANVMTVTLSTDHRCVDGALGAELLGAFKRYIENPMGMLV